MKAMLKEILCRTIIIMLSLMMIIMSPKYFAPRPRQACVRTTFVTGRYCSKKKNNKGLQYKFQNFTKTFIWKVEGIIDELTTIVGTKNISTSQAVREQHGKDESYHSIQPPDLVVWPGSTEEVSGVARLCNQHHIAMIPFGTGTGVEGGVVATEVRNILNIVKFSKFSLFSSWMSCYSLWYIF